MSQFEALARRLVEGSFRRLSGGHMAPLELVARLSQAMEDGQVQGFAPDEYFVWLHPDDHAAVMAEVDDLPYSLAEYLMQLAERARLRLHVRPAVAVLPDGTVTRLQPRIEARHQSRPDAATQMGGASRRAGQTAADEVLAAVQAFVILPDRRHVQLDRPVMNLGRRADNDIVLEGGQVSRRHAQICWRHDRFIIYDLGSRSGTLVNEMAVRECVLHPGDVIRLADVALIYGEGNETRPERPDDDDGGTLALPRVE